MDLCDFKVGYLPGLMPNENHDVIISCFIHPTSIAGDQTIPTTNADFTLFKIAPLISKCGAFQAPFTAPTCPECQEEQQPPCPPPRHHSPECHKDKKCEKKFKKLDKNDDGVVSYEEYKKYCEKRRKHHYH